MSGAGALLEVRTPPGLRAAFSTRQGGVSGQPWATANLSGATGDNWADVRSNRRALCAAFGCDPNRVALLRQVHGARVVTVEGVAAGAGLLGSDDDRERADGLVTAAPDLALLVLSADCVPVLFWRRDATAVGAAHAGWRGLVAGVVQEAVRALPGKGPVDAAIGPAVGRGHYEVEAELAARFAARFGESVRTGRRVDLRACAALCLAEAGVDPQRIQRVGGCTVGDADRFFSHRRDGGRTGRQGGLIMRRTSAGGPDGMAPSGA